MGADRKKVVNLMGEVFSDTVAKIRLNMEEAGRLTRAVLCKAIDPDVSDEEAAEVIQRGRAFVSAISNQEGIIEKKDDIEVTNYLVEKSLIEALIEDTKDVEVIGSWGSNIEDLKKRFAKNEDDSDDKSEDDSEDDNKDNKKETKKTDDNEGGEDKKDEDKKDETEESVWNRTYDLNTKPVKDEDWGIDPDTVRG